MKRLFLYLIVIVTLFVFVGCNNSNTNDKKQQSEHSIPVNEKAETTVITTEYYTIEVPKSWETDCFYEIIEKQSHNYYLKFYDKASYDEIGCGSLFSINLFTENENYLPIPQREVLGSLEVQSIGSYNMVVIYPSDVQFSENTAAKYAELVSEIPDILKTISFSDNCTFSKKTIPIVELEETEPAIEPEEKRPEIFENFIGKWNYIYGSSLGGATDWSVEFRSDGTGTMWLVFEADDILSADFEYETFDTHLRGMDGILIKVDGDADIRYMASYGWSNELQKMLMTLYDVKNSGAPNLNIYWIFAND